MGQYQIAQKRGKEGRGLVGGREKIFEAVRTENFPNMMKIINSQFPDAQQTSTRINTKETIPFILKLLKTSGKKKLLEKRHKELLHTSH